MNECRVLHLEKEDPRFNLAIEETIAKSGGEKKSSPIIRFWKNPPCVVIGRFQNVEAEVYLDICKNRDISVLRRFTGGGAVYHDFRNLNFSISLPPDHYLVKDNLSSSFFQIMGDVIINSLEKLGLDSRCELNNVFVGDKKVSGMASTRTYGGIFIHASILINADISSLMDVLNTENIDFQGKKYVESKFEKVSNISEYLDNISTKGFANVLEKSLEENWKCNLEEDSLCDQERIQAKNFFENKYINDHNCAYFSD